MFNISRAATKAASLSMLLSSVSAVAAVIPEFSMGVKPELSQLEGRIAGRCFKPGLERAFAALHYGGRFPTPYGHSTSFVFGALIDEEGILAPDHYDRAADSEEAMAEVESLIRSETVEPHGFRFPPDRTVTWIRGSGVEWHYRVLEDGGLVMEVHEEWSDAPSMSCVFSDPL